MLRFLTCTLLLNLFTLAPAATQVAPVRSASDFTLKDQNAETFHLSRYKGKVVLLNFWATWCAPCRVEMPWFEEFSSRYRDRGLIVVGLSMDEEGWKSVRPMIAKMHITYPIALANKSVARSYAVTESLPVTFLIDRQGRVQEVRNGFRKKEEFEKLIEEQLAR